MNLPSGWLKNAIDSSLCGVFNLFVFPVSELFSAAFFQQMKCVFGEDKSFL